MTTPESIADSAARLLKQSLWEAGADIIQAWTVAVDEAEANDAEPALTVGFTIKLDLAHSKLTTRLSYGVRRKFEHAGDISDPNQPELLEPSNE